MATHREVKDLLYEQVARIGQAAASPKRLELIELLCQGEKTVETLAHEADIDVKSASAHLKALKAARLAAARRQGKYVRYRLADDAVARFWVALRTLAEGRLLELQQVLSQFVHQPRELTALDGRTVLGRAREGEVVVLDVRPAEEFAVGHLPFARSIPLSELRRRLAELPRSKEIVAYCRGPFCLFATDAVALLRRKGFRAERLDDGVAEWRAAGLPVEAGAGPG
ncbi:MAG TPA: metalloregulator ArsR/SmtB family transcription factor [Casimicrobiaceae bacterium]|nr:metalloregulator ArsR/SmtB family transcription factor [Casimicrobiaceae bacterium]